MRDAQIGVLCPRRAVIGADLDMNVTFRGVRIGGLIRHVEEVDCVVRADGNRGIATVSLRLTVRNNVFCPGYSAIATHSDASITIAVSHRQINGAVRPNFNMAMDTAALRSVTLGSSYGPSTLPYNGNTTQCGGNHGHGYRRAA